MRIAYFVHNFADPAVAKRVRMLRAFGDEVVLLGFHRDEKTIDRVEGVETIDLGRTFDANLRQRMAAVAKQCLRLRRWGKRIRGCDVIIARNLETLVLAALARWRYAPRARLAYECLDIHRLLLSGGIGGTAMRGLERALLRKTDVTVVSSPAFLREYFAPRYGAEFPALLVENKLLLPPGPGASSAGTAEALPPGPPWRIGWFGMIRCRKSLDLLCDLALRHPGLLTVTIRGRPSRTEFDDFDAQVARTPGVSFGGTYHPAELESLYGSVHFNWAIDYFEEGANSRWLLPNRIYEGGTYRAVPIALKGNETARWLERLGIGVTLGAAGDVEDFLTRLTVAGYRELKDASDRAPRAAFLADDADCARLLEGLRGNGQSASVEFDFRQTGEASDNAAM